MTPGHRWAVHAVGLAKEMRVSNYSTLARGTALRLWWGRHFCLSESSSAGIPARRDHSSPLCESEYTPALADSTQTGMSTPPNATDKNVCFTKTNLHSTSASATLSPDRRPLA